MAIGTPVQRYAARIANVSEGSTGFSPVSTVAAGNKAILLTGVSECYLTAVSDSVGGNTWTAHYHSGVDGDFNISAASCDVVNPITSGDTITMTWSSTHNNNRNVFLIEVSGIATGAGAFDQSAAADSPGAASLNVGPTGTLAQADELGLLMACDTVGSVTITSAPGGWSPSPGTPDYDVGHLQYQITAATTALSVTNGTFSSPSGWDAAIVTFKGAGAAPTYTILNGSDEQLLNVNAGGIDVDAATYKDGVELTESELAALLSASFGKKNIAVLPDLTGVADARQIKKTTFSAETESA